MSKKTEKSQTEITTVRPDDISLRGKPQFMSPESFKLVSGAFHEENHFKQTTERYSIVADLLDREPPSKWASIIELAFDYHSGRLPVPRVILKKDELPSKPLHMSITSFREAVVKHQAMLDEVEKTVKENAADESVRYVALAIMLATHKDRLERTLLLIKAHFYHTLYPCGHNKKKPFEANDADARKDEDATPESSRTFALYEKKFLEHFEDVFAESRMGYEELKAKVDPKTWDRFCIACDVHMNADQMRILLGDKYFRDFDRSEALEFATREELGAAVQVKKMPDWLAHHVKTCWQIITNSKESSVIDTQLRKLRLLVNMDWGHPLPQVSRNEFVKRMNEQLYGREELVTQMAQLLSLAKNQKAVTFQTPIILTGAFGVGKSAFAKAVAGASGRSFVEVNCAGHSDPENLFGSSDIYVNGMHGLFLKRVAEKKSDAPVLFIDEPEKALARAGSVANGLLSLTEAGMLEDHFVGIPMDLSRAIVILAVNDIQALPVAIRNRCHIIEVNDYSNGEKCIIARDYIWRGMQNSLVEQARCPITEEAVKLVVEHSHDETGMRKVRRILQQLMRYAVDQLEQGNKMACIDEAVVEAVVGLPRSKHVEDSRACGCFNSLAVSDHLGQVLRIESIVNESAGESRLQLFGNASDVMKESGQLALEVLRRTQGASALQAQVHLEEAGIKKDGPSAGLAMFLSMYSALKGIPVSQTVAATGEMTLLGKVHPVGAVAQKLRAAANAGCKQVLIPKANMADVPADLVSALTVVPVSTVDEAIAWMSAQCV